MYISKELYSAQSSHIPRNRFSWLFMSDIMWIYQKEEINMGAALGTEL